MTTYPRNLAELEALVSNVESCREYLAQTRWPDGFTCPSCGGRESWRMAGGRWLCQDCRRQVSATAGTIFQDSRMGLDTWFRAIWHVTCQKSGASALGLQREIGFGSYQTAWAWLQKLRRAMVRQGRDRLSGTVEVDETYLGGHRPGKRGRGADGKTLVFIAAELKDGRIGRIRLQVLEDASQESLPAAVQAAIEPGSQVVTDGWDGYNPIESMGYRRKVARSDTGPGANLLPSCHRVASLLKRWILGTHQGAVSKEHLSYYLDEFTFRFNRRSSGSRGLLFYRLLQQAAQTPPHTYRDIVNPQDMGGG